MDKSRVNELVSVKTAKYNNTENFNTDANNNVTKTRLQPPPSLPLQSTVTQPIWKSFIYEPNTSIYLVKREKIENFLTNKTYLLIAQKTKCKICLYANNDASGVVYFTINGPYDARCNALEQIREETNRAGVIVNLPSLINTDANTNTNNINSTKQIKSANLHTPTRSQFTFDDLAASNSKQRTSQAPISTFKRTKSFHNKLSDINNNNSEQQTQQTSTQTSSILTSQPIQQSNSGSNRKYNNNSNNNNNTNNANFNNSTHKSDNILQSRQLDSNRGGSLIQAKNGKHRYAFEFLLKRADDIQSKQLPKDWPELNMKYPNICFCGRVISYFNPHKYHTYWEKIKQSNQHLHVAD